MIPPDFKEVMVVVVYWCVCAELVSNGDDDVESRTDETNDVGAAVPMLISIREDAPSISGWHLIICTWCKKPF